MLDSINDISPWEHKIEKKSVEMTNENHNGAIVDEMNIDTTGGLFGASSIFRLFACQ